tara:strand:- start:589 stop:1770 length:1182 start_codon:yes stop_codon:yes gene_type:complete
VEIGQIKKRIVDNEVILEATISHDQKKSNLWYSFDKSVVDFLTIEKHDGFLVGSLLLAMKIGSDIYIEGKLSPKLYYNLTNYFIPITLSLIPSLNNVRIFHKGFINSRQYKHGAGVMTGFSAGIDSFCTVYDHLHRDIQDEYRITHFLFNNVGSHGDGEKGKELFNSRFNLIKGFCDEEAVPILKVNSNLNQILDLDFQLTHVTRNVSVALLLQGLIGKFYYASTFKYEDCNIRETYDFAYADPFSLHLLSTESLECISTGCQYSRVDKTKKVACLKSSYKWLNVCVDPLKDGTNCSACWKCSRTLFTLELIKKINNYESVFNLSNWHKFKKWYFRTTILNYRINDPFTKEIRDLAYEMKYRFKVIDRLYGLILSLVPTKINRIINFFVRRGI